MEPAPGAPVSSTSLPPSASAANPTGEPTPTRMVPEGVRLVRHGRLPVGLLLRVDQLRQLFDAHSFWAQNRSRAALLRMLLGSATVVSAWRGGQLVGIGRATSDGVFRAVLWDVVVAAEHQGQGLGRRIVETLMNSPSVAAAERVYLMTTNGSGFYARLGFTEHHGQKLLVNYRTSTGAESGTESGKESSRKGRQ